MRWEEKGSLGEIYDFLDRTARPPFFAYASASYTLQYFLLFLEAAANDPLLFIRLVFGYSFFLTSLNTNLFDRVKDMRTDITTCAGAQ